jgi:hypothetical protein
MIDVNKSSAPLLHFVVGIDPQRGLLGFCCESQPLFTIRSYGHPKRCPLCQKENPVSTSLSMDKNEEKI